MSIELLPGKPAVGTTGFGLMSLSLYRTLSQEEANECMKTALEQGSNFWNGGEFYGPPEDRTLNMRLINGFFEQNPAAKDQVILSIKGGINTATFQPTSSREEIHKSIDTILDHLKGSGKFLDQYCLARLKSADAVEEAVKAMAEYIEQGKIGSYCLSEVSASTIRRAHAIHPVGAVEIELSLFSQEAVNNGVLRTCAELGIPVIAYSPLGMGLLTGKVTKDGEGVRPHFDRFKPEIMDKNQHGVDKIVEVADRAGILPSQLAIEWVRRQSRKNSEYPVILPIPGTSKPSRIVENAKAIDLKQSDLNEVDAFFQKFERAGSRYFGPANDLLYM